MAGGIGSSTTKGKQSRKNKYSSYVTRNLCLPWRDFIHTVIWIVGHTPNHTKQYFSSYSFVVFRQFECLHHHQGGELKMQRRVSHPSLNHNQSFIRKAFKLEANDSTSFCPPADSALPNCPDLTIGPWLQLFDTWTRSSFLRLVSAICTTSTPFHPFLLLFTERKVFSLLHKCMLILISCSGCCD